ncbi:hypothetical protein TcBrA4_0045780 [Trypanosoma cruzi]|nr:hypothetical protein TcBrA4_0045780 [Trypanosoma cruzi]
MRPLHRSLLRRTYNSEGGITTNTTTSNINTNTTAANVPNATTKLQSNTHLLAGQSKGMRRPPSSSLGSTAEKRVIETLRSDLAAAQLRISELQLSQLAVHEALLRRLEETDRAAHKTATELRYTALALQCHYDLLETELRRTLALGPHSTTTEKECAAEDMELLRQTAIEAASREMVRKNIGFRVEKVSEEPAAVSRVTSDLNL